MSTVVMDKISEAQDQVVGTLGLVKEPVVTGVSTVTQFVLDNVATLPVAPFAEQIPTPKEVIDNQYKFAKKVIDTNKDVALAVAKAAAPVTDKVLDRKAAAPKATAKKAPARKSTTKKASA